MSRRKGTPCGCGCADPCKKTNCIKTVNNVSPDPNGDFWVEPGVGIRVVETEYGIKITNLIDPDYLVAGANIELTPTDTHLEIALKDDISIGNLNVAGDIIQQGSSYETHAEQIYTTDDYIIMRDEAVGGLASGSYSGFQVKKYDGTNDGRLVIDNTGTARVGDVGDEQPLLTRSESGSLSDGQLFKWDAGNSKAVGQSLDTVPTSGSNAPVTSDGIFTALKNNIGFASCSSDSITCTNNDTDYDMSNVAVTTDKSNGFFSVTSGGTITALKPCLIRVSGSFAVSNTSGIQRCGPSLYMNSTRLITNTIAIATVNYTGGFYTYTKNLNVGDNLKIKFRSVGGGAVVTPTMDILALNI